MGGKHSDRQIREGVVKLKFEDFSITSAQRPMDKIEPHVFEELIQEAWVRGDGKSVRLIGAGVRFVSEKKKEAISPQLEMFDV